MKNYKITTYYVRQGCSARTQLDWSRTCPFLTRSQKFRSSPVHINLPVNYILRRLSPSDLKPFPPPNFLPVSLYGRIL